MGDLKVSSEVLDEFMLLSGEMTVIRNMIMKYTGNKEFSQLTEFLEELHKINGNIQNKITEMRKVPLSDIFADLPQWLAMLVSETTISMSGTDMRVDTSIAGGLNGFVRPLIQYALKATYKNKIAGKMQLNFSGSNEYILVSFIDQTIETDKVAQREYLADWQQDSELGNVIVGLQAIGGSITAELFKSCGVKWILKIPVPRSVLITHCLFVKGYDMEIGLPENNIIRIIKVTNENRKELLRSLIDTQILLLDGQILPMINLSEVLKQGSYTSIPDDDFNVIILRTTQNIKFALIVDEVIDIEDAVVKQLSGPIKKIGLYMGATFLGAGNLGLIMSIDGLAKNCGIDQLQTQLKNNVEVSKLVEATLDKNLAEGEEKEVMLFELFLEGRYCMLQKDIFRLEEFDSEKVQQSGEAWVVPYRDSFLTLLDISEWLEGGNAFNMAGRSDVSRWTTIVIQKGKFYLGLVVRAITDSAKMVGEPQESLKKQSGIKGHFLLGEHTVTCLDILELAHSLDKVDTEKRESQLKTA